MASKKTCGMRSRRRRECMAWYRLRGWLQRLVANHAAGERLLPANGAGTKYHGAKGRHLQVARGTPCLDLCKFRDCGGRPETPRPRRRRLVCSLRSFAVLNYLAVLKITKWVHCPAVPPPRPCSSCLGLPRARACHTRRHPRWPRRIAR